MSTRVSKWRSALAAYLEKLRKKPFAYGATDCACFASGAVEAMTGVDPMADIRGRYASVRGAKKILKDAGGVSLGDFVARSFEEIHPAMGRDGDLALVETQGPFGAALGVISGERVMVMSESGLDSLDRANASRAFRV